MRLFIAIDLDDAARAAIAAEASRLAQRIPRRSSLRWLKPVQLHLTLVFLGEVDDGRAAAIAAAMDAAVDLPPFDAALEGFGVFPPRGAPRVLWVGVGDGAATLIELERRLAGRVERLGVEIEPRPFHPHLTLARWRDSRPGDRRALDEAPRGVVARLWVDHATLYRSRLSPGGSIYTPLARATLR